MGLGLHLIITLKKKKKKITDHNSHWLDKRMIITRTTISICTRLFRVKLKIKPRRFMPVQIFKGLVVPNRIWTRGINVVNKKFTL